MTVPAARPVTTPSSSMVALVGLVLIHVPPVVGVSVMVFPTQTAVGPVIVGCGLTNTFLVAFTAPQGPVGSFVVKRNWAVPVKLTAGVYVTVAGVVVPPV